MPEYVPYLSSNLLSIKVPLLLPRGFSANMILLIWYFCGGVCLWGFEGNILALMFKPVYEDPVDTIEEVIARGLIPVTYNYGWKYHFERSSNQMYRDLAKIIVVPSDNEELLTILEYQVQGNATHVYIGNHVYENMKDMGLWHFSQEIIERSNPYLVWITNKMFYLSEDLAKHILIYQQVC